MGRRQCYASAHSCTDLATAHCFRQSASYCTPRIQGRTDAYQTVLLVARHQQRRRKVNKSCAPCQKAKNHVHTKMPLERLPAPTKRFSHIHIDLVGPLNPPCEGKNTLLTIIDRWTGWPEAFPMTMHGDAANAKACAKVLVREWLSRWGVPDIMTSDRGSQFVSDLWLEVCSLMGIARVPTTSYQPQHNGKIERMHRSLNKSLRARLLGRVN